MKSIFILTLLSLQAYAYLDLRPEALRVQFVEFMTNYNRHYASYAEMERRFQIFSENMNISEALMVANKGSASFGVGPFIDISKEEFVKTHLMSNFPKDLPKLPSVRLPPANLTGRGFPKGPDPNNWDWSSAGVTTPVYNQGQCGSCWAFSATETIESYWALSGQALTQLAMEQIVDCDTTDNGCGGGIPTQAYAYVQGAGGIDSLTNYPYTAGGGTAGSCQFPQGNVVANVGSSASVEGESGLYSTCSSAGPVSVCVDASSWQTYNGGIMTSCGSQIDHCVQLTGYYNYNGQGGTPAWNIRNSWSTSWGISGYIQLAVGSDLCGVGNQASVVTTSTPAKRSL